MNLQQLNQSGRSLHDFILTAVIALLFTLFTWWLMEELNGFLSWRNQAHERADRGPFPNHALVVRILIFAWMIKDGHWAWMRHTGAARRILSNSSKGFETNYGLYEEYRGLPASVYVSKFLRDPPKNKWASPWDFDVGGWNITRKNMEHSS